MAQSTIDMTGKICMVTGATQGIGRETARALAGMGAAVIVVARSESRGRATVDEIKAGTGSPNVTLMLADFSSQASIRGLAADFKKQYSRLDVLVNNAGVINLNRSVTVDGLEATFATNHLGYFLLTNLLLDVLKASAPARIVNVASGASIGAKINFDDLQSEKRYGVMEAYSQSKLANVMFTVALAKRLQGSGVTANTLHPGFVASGFARNNGPLIRHVLMPIVALFAMSPEQGAETQIYLATSPEVADVTGKYFVKKMVARPNPIVNDEALVERLWAVSEQLTGLA